MSNELIAKIVKAGKDVGGKLSADKTNREQNYDYLSADKILSVCGQALFDQGIVVLPSIKSQETTLFEYTDTYGKAKKRYDSQIGFSFLVTDGEANQELEWYGMGSDYTVPDKALYKAVTSGHKYFLMKLLCIGAGNEDSEHEGEEVTSKPQSKPASKPVVQPAAPPNGHKPDAEPVEPEPAAQQYPIYTGTLTKVGKWSFPATWVKAIMTVEAYRVDQPHIGNLLHNMALPQETDAAEVMRRITEHLASKTN